jgi:quinate dehydrogenase
MGNDDESRSPDTSQPDRVNYLFGHPIAHSLSPLLHLTVYDNVNLKWPQTPLDSIGVPNFLRLTQPPKFIGVSVTMPHKVAIIQHLDEFTQEDGDIGACNTIFLRDQAGRRILYGTDNCC